MKKEKVKCKENSSVKVGFFYLMGTFFYRGISFLLIPVYTRMLSAYDYGIVSTFASWVSIVSIIMGLSTQSSIRTSFIDYQGRESKFLSSVISFKLVWFALVTMLCMAISHFVSDLAHNILIYCCVVQSIFIALFNDYSTYLMMKRDYARRIFIMIIPEIAVHVISVYTLYYLRFTQYSGKTYLGKIIPTTIIYLFCSFCFIFLIRNEARFIIDKDMIIYALTISLPMIFHGISLYILNQSDKIMITKLRNAEETGIYSYIYNIGQIILAVSTALEGVWLPWFTKKIADRSYKEISAKVYLYVTAMTMISVVILLISPEGVKLLAPLSYWKGVGLVPPILMANYCIFLYSLYVNVEYIYKQTRAISLNSICAAVCNIVLNFVFIPVYGYMAAAWTTFAAYVIAFILHYINARRIDSDIFSILIFFKPLGFLVIANFLYYIFIDKPLIRYCVIVVDLVATFVDNRHAVRFMFNNR